MSKESTAEFYMPSHTEWSKCSLDLQYISYQNLPIKEQKISQISEQNFSNIQYVFLDLDGVFRVDRATYVDKPEKLLLIQENINALKVIAENYPVAICTSQSGIGRKYYTEAFFRESAKLLCKAVGKSLPFFYCPHTPEDQCLCRKPKSGLLDSARQYFESIEGKKIDPAACIMVGDGNRDTEAGINAECGAAVLLHPVKLEKNDKTYRMLPDEEIAKNMTELKKLAEQKNNKTKVFYTTSFADIELFLKKSPSCPNITSKP